MPLRPTLFALFVLVPIAEIVLFVVVGQRIGVWWLLGLVLLTALVGAAMVSRQGRSVWADLKAEFGDGRFPGKQLAHAAMIVAAGSLLLTPGFLTDAVGLLLLVPSVREWIRIRLVRRFSPSNIITL